jgi:phosphoserine phosphatase RsbU/P
LAAAAEGIVISDARLPDMPLIYVNSGFERLTGYSAESVLGRNCRFLQGPGTDPQAAREIRRAIEEKRECLVEILNYRKDGTPFWNRLSITPIWDHCGQVTHFIGVQSDISRRQEAEEALRHAKSELESVNRRMKQELEMAARIQQTMLPPQNQSLAGVNLSWLFRPCMELAGDTLNIIPFDDHQVAFYIIDVSGHGVGSALLSVTLNRWLSPLPGRFCVFPRIGSDPMHFDIASPAAVARQLNQQFPMMTDIPQYFTMLYGILDLRDGRCRYVSAGHPGPIRVPKSGLPARLPGEGYPVGLLPGADYQDCHIQLQPGDRLFLYTDGVTDAMNGEELEFGAGKLESVLAESRGLPLPESLDAVLAALRCWCENAPFHDDITLLGVEYLPSMVRGED